MLYISIRLFSLSLTFNSCKMFGRLIQFLNPAGQLVCFMYLVVLELLAQQSRLVVKLLNIVVALLFHIFSSLAVGKSETNINCRHNFAI